MQSPAFPAFDRPVSSQDGVFVFPEVSHGEDAAAAARLARLNAVAPVEGWRAAIAAAFGDDDYATDERRAAFLALLPTDRGQAVLEIGCSLGQITVPLARRVGTLDAIEVVPEQARFCAERVRQEGIQTVRVAAGGADCRLPYQDASFDGVVLNLVFEWCGGRAEDHRAAQERLLGEIRRVLRPGGYFYLTTKNRYALRLLLGGRDEHMFGMRWGSALPRWLAGIALRGRRAEGQLYSYKALRTMLKTAGFGAIDAFWTVPEMRRPVAMVSLRAAKVRAWRRSNVIAQGDGRSTARLMAMVPARLVRHVAPNLTFLCRAV